MLRSYYPSPKNGAEIEGSSGVHGDKVEAPPHSMADVASNSAAPEPVRRP